MAANENMHAKTTEELITIARRLGWAVTPSLFAEYGTSVLFSKFSPAGQDFNFEIDADNLIPDLRGHINRFDDTEQEAEACKRMMRELLDEWER